MAPIASPSASAPSVSLPLVRRFASSLQARSSAASPSTTASFARSLTLRLSNALSRRQEDDSVVATHYGSINSGPPPGTVAGIVLGSVAGFLLILWLIYTCLNFGQPWSGTQYTGSVVARSRRKSHHGSTRSRRVSETVEVRRALSRSPIRVVPPPMAPPPPMGRVIVEESRTSRRERSRGGSDEVVVIEEHSPPRRSKSKRESRGSRDGGGFRTVDPNAYGGVVGGRKSSRR